MFPQVSKHGDPVKTALVVPGVMLLNGGIFLSIFNGISKLMAAKVGRVAPWRRGGGAHHGECLGYGSVI